MAKPDIETMSLRIEQKWTEAESRIIQDIVRRIKKNGKITSTADYQINRLIELGRSTEEIEQILKEALEATYPEMYELYDEVANWQYVRNRDVYEQVNGHFIPPEENEYMMQVSDAIKKQTADELVNLAQSYGFTVLVGNKKVFTPFAQYYQKYVDSAIMDIISGGYDYNTVIRRTVTQMTNSGLRTVDYASGHSNRVPVAVRRSIMTGISQLTGKINERNAKLLGTDYFEVDWHPGARPDHAVWQGKVYSKTELETVCGLGTVTGLCGANCRHLYYPFIPGVSERLYTDEWLDEQNRKEAQTKEWKGKEYNAYEQTQKMRQMETSMRAQREKIAALQAAGADEDDILIAKAKYQGQLNEYSRFCKKMGLEEQRERIYYDMRGKLATNTKKQNAQYTAEMIKNATRDSKQYNRYKSIIGDSAGTLAQFRQMKYNDVEKFGLLTDYMSSVKSGMISSLSGFTNYATLYMRIENEVVGIETLNGVKVNSQSRHFIERVIGTSEDPKTGRPRSGVSIENIKEALLKGKIRTSARDPDSIKYITDECIVSLNPKTGNLIQCNPQ